MSKSKKAKRRQVIKQGFPKKPAKKLNKTPPEKKFNMDMFIADFLNFKTKTSQDLIETNKMVSDLRRESTNLSMCIGAILDTIADAIAIPSQILTNRFISYCDDRQILDGDGNTKGNLQITRYGF